MKMVCRAYEYLDSSSNGKRGAMFFECIDDSGGRDSKLPDGTRQIFSIWCDPDDALDRKYLRKEAERRYVPLELVDRVLQERA